MSKTKRDTGRSQEKLTLHRDISRHNTHVYIIGEQEVDYFLMSQGKMQKFNYFGILCL